MEISTLGMTFDLEGTLVDLELAHHLGHLETARELGLTLTLDKAIQRFPSFVGGPDRAVATELHDASGTTMTISDIIARTREHYEKLKSALPIKPRPGALQFLAEARARRYRMALGSVTSRGEGCALLKATGLAEYFVDQYRVFLEDVIEPKPAAAVYHETARRLGINPSDQIVFEDSPNGVKAASSAGSFVVAVPAVNNQTIRDRLVATGAMCIFEGWTAMTIEAVMRVIAERQ